MIGSGSFLGTLSSSLFLSSVFFRVGALGAPLKPPGGLNFFKNGLWKGGSFNSGCSDLPRSKMLQTTFFFKNFGFFFTLGVWLLINPKKSLFWTFWWSYSPLWLIWGRRLRIWGQIWAKMSPYPLYRPRNEHKRPRIWIFNVYLLIALISCMVLHWK